MPITHLKARQILDSRGNPTVEVDVWARNLTARASVPSGASTGTHEAVELRDGGQQWNGKGVLKAVGHVNEELRDLLVGMDPLDQRGVDSKMLALDGTANKSRLGANAILGCSLAVAKLGAMVKAMPLYRHFADLGTLHKAGFPRQRREDDILVLPTPLMNVINGGKHADNTLDLQEFMIVPQAESFSARLQIGVEVFHALKRLLQERNMSTSVGDEGGFAPDLQTNEEAIGLLLQAADLAGHGGKVKIALDCAASEFFKDGQYVLEGEVISAEKLIDYYAYLCDKYPIISIEDPLAENDWEHWTALTRRLGKTVQIVGDDLLVTNVTRLRRAIDEKACNAILIKLNQIGTVSETIEAVQTAKSAGFGTIISHRSGETEDTSIADLAVGLACGQIKTGSLSRTDRVAKYNQLLRIEEEIRG